MEESYERDREGLRFLPTGPLSVAAGLWFQPRTQEQVSNGKSQLPAQPTDPGKSGALPVGNGCQNWGVRKRGRVGYGKVMGFLLIFHSLI